MLDVLNFLKKKDKPAEIRHLALSLKGVIEWAKKSDKPFDVAFAKRDKIILDLINLMIEKNIPILTIHVFPQNQNANNEENTISTKHESETKTIVFIKSW